MSADNNYVVADVDQLTSHALLVLHEDPEIYTDQEFRRLGGLSWLEERQEFAFGMRLTCFLVGCFVPLSDFSQVYSLIF